MSPMRWALAFLVVPIGCLQGAAQEPRRPGPVPLELHNVLIAVAFAPDGGTVYGGGGSIAGTPRRTPICAWDSATGKLLRELRGQNLPVSSLALSPDGT
ncbi:MAG: hypothetical protein EHM91_05755, partial [Planctomycetota bacterium]